MTALCSEMAHTAVLARRVLDLWKTPAAQEGASWQSIIEETRFAPALGLTEYELEKQELILEIAEQMGAARARSQRRINAIREGVWADLLLHLSGDKGVAALDN
jgi:hypothetical protein